MKNVEIIAVYGRGRNINLKSFWFESREEAKMWAKTNLDQDDACSRYTIYG